MLYNLRICKRNTAERGQMALLRYLQRKDGLPDPKGSLSSEVPAATIARANQEVQAAPDHENILTRKFPELQYSL